MKNKVLYIVVITGLFACTATSEKPQGWVNLDGTSVSDKAEFNASLEKCDYIRADRTALIDFDAKALLGLQTARECMEKEGYLLKK
ncbi:hypothetical protein WNY77_21345 [Paraglaciecola mesophila]|uniref:Lipoprotein n=1 Tax=Paraglaciecola mesophila TaxID=197222 RepID=A0ABU9T1E9_9ALTE